MVVPYSSPVQLVSYDYKTDYPKGQFYYPEEYKRKGYAFTGHRPEKLGGYGPKAQALIHTFAMETVECLNAEYISVGMAQGWDMEVAFAATRLGIAVHAFIPFKDQEKVWPWDVQQRYHTILKKCVNVTLCCPEGGYAAIKYQVRNQMMVRSAGNLVALYDGSAGGTKNCIQYTANNLPDVSIVNLWPDWLEFLEQHQ